MKFIKKNIKKHIPLYSIADLNKLTNVANFELFISQQLFSDDIFTRNKYFTILSYLVYSDLLSLSLRESCNDLFRFFLILTIRSLDRPLLSPLIRRVSRAHGYKLYDSSNTIERFVFSYSKYFEAYASEFLQYLEKTFLCIYTVRPDIIILKNIINVIKT